jgi:peptidoglycan/LPS O-acetylase OafA/YrhL
VLPGGIPTELVGLCASVAICIAVSYAAYRLVEVPSQRWSRAIRLKRPARLQREFA